MTRTALRRSAGAAVAAFLVSAGAAVSIVPAHADDKDDRFIEHLDQQGVPYSSETEAIQMAKEFCLDATRQGTPDWRAGYNLQDASGWSGTEIAAFAEGAIPTYCPKLWK